MTVTFHNRHRLKRKHIKHFLADLQDKFHIPLFDDKSAIDIARYENQKIIIVDDGIDFFYYKNTIFFTLNQRTISSLLIWVQLALLPMVLML